MNQHRPGQWPVDEPADLDARSAGEVTEEELYVKRAAERGRREIVLGSIRAHLDEQPTAAAVQSVARHWCADVTAIGDAIAKTKPRAA